MLGFNKIKFIFLGFYSFFVCNSVFAQTKTYVPLVSDGPFKQIAESANLNEFLLTLYNFGVGVAVSLSILFIILGGIQYMTTDAVGKMEEGKKRMLDAVVGLLIALSSWLIINQINPKIFETDLGLSSLKATDKTTVILGGGNPPGGNQPGGGQGNPPFNPGGTASEQEIMTYLNSLSSGRRSSDGSFFFTTYGGPNDRTPDSNTQKGLGNRNNLLSPGSVALSRDLISTHKPAPGASIYINGNFLGYYDDSTADQYQGVEIRNTVDVYNPSGIMGQQLKKIDPNNWNITFGQVRPQTPHPNP
jgi:hypothetical protein